MKCKIDNCVVPEKIYYPTIIVSKLFKIWGIKCGNCSMDFHRFAFFGKPRCPYCGIKNTPQFDLFL